MTSAKEKLAKNVPLTEHDMQELERQGVASPPLKVGKITKGRMVKKSDGAVDFFIHEEPQVVSRIPHYAEQAILSRSAKVAKKRGQILEKGYDSYNFLTKGGLSYGLNVSGTPPTRWELRQQALKMDKNGLVAEINSLRDILEFDNLKEKMIVKIRGDILVSKCNRPRDFPMSEMSKDAQNEIEKLVAEEFKSFERHFKALKKALPYLQENLEIYQEALSDLEAKQSDNGWIKETQKHLEKLSQNADKIIKELEKPLNQIIYDRPTEERLQKVCILVQSYRQIEREFQAANKELEQFNVSLDVNLRSLHILPDVVKKALGKTKPETEKKQRQILSKFTMGR